MESQNFWKDVLWDFGNFWSWCGPPAVLLGGRGGGAHKKDSWVTPLCILLKNMLHNLTCLIPNISVIFIEGWMDRRTEGQTNTEKQIDGSTEQQKDR